LIAFQCPAQAIDEHNLDAVIQETQRRYGAGVDKMEIARWLKGVIEKHIDSPNDAEGIPIYGPIALALGRSKDDYKKFAEDAWEAELGNCQECSTITYSILKQAGVRESLRIMRIGGHQFCVWDLPISADIQDPKTWGKAMVVDPWVNKVLDAKAVQTNSHFQNGDPKKTIEDATMEFDANADPWQEVQQRDQNASIFNTRLQERKAAAQKLKSEAVEKASFILKNMKALQNSISKMKEIKMSLHDTRNDINSFILDEFNKDFSDHFQYFELESKRIEEAISEGEALVIAKTNSAKNRAENCNTQADSDFVKANYLAACQAFDLMDELFNKARKISHEFDLKLKSFNQRIQKFDTVLNTQELNDRYVRFCKHEYASQANAALIAEACNEWKTLIARKEKLQKDLKHLSSYHHLKLRNDPTYEDDLRVIESSLNAIAPHTEFDATLYTQLADQSKSESEDLRNFIETKLQPLIGNLTDALSKYGKDSFKSHEEFLKRVEEQYLYALFVIKANEGLANGCDCPPSPSPIQPAMDPPTDPRSPTRTSETSDNSNETLNELFIVGPDSITVGKAAEFYAVDNSGNAFHPAEGEFIWQTGSFEHLELARSGASVTALGKKATNTLIVAKYKGMSAWKTVAIVNNPNSDADSSEIDDENLFATDGGEQVDASDQEPSTNNPGEDFTPPDSCESLRDEIAKALRHRNADLARNKAAIAAAIGCDLNFGAIVEIIKEIEDEEQLAQEVALLDQESEQLTHEHEAWMQQYEEEQKKFREEVEQNRKRRGENQQWQDTQDFMQEMINLWYASSQNPSEGNSINRDESPNNPWSSPTIDDSENNSMPLPSDAQRHEVTYWTNGNIKEERYYYDSGKLKKLLTYEEKTGFFVSLKEYSPNGRLKYFMTHWHNNRDDLGIAREKFYNDSGKLIKEIGYNQDGSVREVREY